MIAHVRTYRPHRKAFACCACGDTVRLIFVNGGALLSFCRPCAATYSRTLVEGATP